MARNYLQGKFEPRNPEKYVGNVNNIIFRSSWERKFLIYCDTQPNILKYASEEFAIPYISPVDNRMHRYFVDFIMTYKTKTGEIKKAAVEIKPYSQTMLPKTPKRITESFKESVKTYNINLSKWAAAKKWCDDQGMDFIIITEKELGL